MVFQALARASLLLFYADNLAKVVTGNWELVNAVLRIGFGSSVQYTVVAEQQLVDDVSLYRGLCLKPSEVEDEAVITVLNVDFTIRAIKCIKQHCRKHDIEKSGGQETFFLNSICLEPLHACCHEIVGRWWWILPQFSKGRLCWSWQILTINISRIGNTFVTQLPWWVIILLSGLVRPWFLQLAVKLAKICEKKCKSN